MVLFRGTKIPLQEIEQQMSPGSELSLQGFTSTSLDKDVAMQYAIQSKSLSTDLTDYPVLYEIFFTKNQGFIKMEQIDSDYPDEKEILLQDGLTFSVLTRSLVQLADHNDQLIDCYHI